MEKDCYKGDLTHAGARFFRRDVLDTINGFDENLVAAEDYDLYNQLEKTEFSIGIIDAEELHLGNLEQSEILYRNSIIMELLLGIFSEKQIKGLKQVSPIRGALFKIGRNSCEIHF